MCSEFRSNQEPLADKLQKSCLPIEFNRKKDLYKLLMDKKTYHEEQIKKLMKIILDKYNKGEDIESLYKEL